MKVAFLVAALGASMTVTGLAAAQPPETVPYAYQAPERPLPEAGRMAAPKNALELSIATGYTQGFGNLASGVGLPTVVSPGIGFDLGVGYRIDPNWAVLVTGQYQEFSAERADAARGVTTSLAAQYHLAPLKPTDPWLEVGGGYRLLWEDPNVGPTVLTHGIQLARVRAGLDFRIDKALAIGPVIGADATLFLFQDAPNVQTNIAEPRVSSFVYGGLQGRFDIGGQRTMDVERLAKR